MQLLSRLRDDIPGLDVLHTDEQLHPYECDGLSVYRSKPLLVVLPRNVEQVQAVMRLAHEVGVPVVARGAGTGLSGGAMPLEQGILLVMARLNQILDLDPVAGIARVQPGVRNIAISQAAQPFRGSLRAGSFFTDRLFDWRQCGRECGRGALPEVRPDRTQYLASESYYRHRRASDSGGLKPWIRPALT